jgi:ribosomal-protein-alanine N-acetyltransferase
MAIENSIFEFPFSENDFKKCLRQRNCIGKVAEYKEKIIGYMLYELHEDTIMMINLGVKESFQRRSVGSQIVDNVIKKIDNKIKNKISLGVRETNFKAQVFFRSKGFIATSVMRNPYDDTAEDAYIMQYYGVNSKWLINNRISQYVN